MIGHTVPSSYTSYSLSRKNEMEPCFRVWKSAFPFLKPLIEIIIHHIECNPMKDCIHSSAHYVNKNWSRTLFLVCAELRMSHSDITDCTLDRFSVKKLRTWQDICSGCK